MIIDHRSMAEKDLLPYSRADFIKAAIGLIITGLPFKSIAMIKPAGISICKSPYAVTETVDRIQTLLESKGARIYARIDQQKELDQTGQVLGPLEFLLFGNPKTGGPVMIENPLAALDLPLKIICWQDEQGMVYVAYNENSYLEARYGLSSRVSDGLNLDPIISTILS